MKKPGLPPALVLFLLAPAIGELLSGSAPPTEFFTPFGFLMIVCLYGSGAVVTRELEIRWKKGIGSVLLLGATYTDTVNYLAPNQHSGNMIEEGALPFKPSSCEISFTAEHSINMRNRHACQHRTSR